MDGIFRYRCRVFLRSSLSAVAIVCMGAALVVAPLIRWVDERTCWTLLGFGPEGAKALVGALLSSLLTFIVFSFSMILLAVQIGGGQLSPRAIGRIFESRLSKVTLGTFVFSYTYTLAALGRIEDRVPQLPVLVVIVTSLLGIIVFLILIQSATQGLRPVAVLAGVAADTRAAIEALHPAPFSASPAELPAPAALPGPEGTVIPHRGRPGFVLAVDGPELAEIARQAGGVIELVPQVGDYLAEGDDFCRLHGIRDDALDEGRLRRCVALGAERVLGNDPVFGFRILVEIACKALSPAINDPATAVLALDQLQHLLRLLGQRRLDPGILRDADGGVRLVYPAPAWEDFVDLALTEIRLFGATSPQVMRRIRALLDDLERGLCAERAAVIPRQRALLGRTIERGLADPEDRDLAGVGDRQGLGGRPCTRGPAPVRRVSSQPAETGMEPRMNTDEHGKSGEQ